MLHRHTLADIVAQYRWSGMDRLVHVRDGNRHDIVLNFDRGKSFALHINGFGWGQSMAGAIWCNSARSAGELKLRSRCSCSLETLMS